jgi:hypothetical protein
VEIGADGDGGVGIDGAVAFFDMADDAFFVDDDVGALGPLVGLVLNVVALQDAVGGEHLVVHVAEERKIDVNLFGEGGIGGGTVHANAENCGIRSVDLTRGDSSLDRLKLFRSTTSKGQDVHGEKDILLAMKVAELYGFPLIAEQSEVRRDITYFQRDFCQFRFLGFLRKRGSHGDKGQRS